MPSSYVSRVKTKAFAEWFANCLSGDEKFFDPCAGEDLVIIENEFKHPPYEGEIVFFYESDGVKSAFVDGFSSALDMCSWASCNREEAIESPLEGR